MLLQSRLHEIPNGFAEVRASRENDRIAAVTFNGDFLADSAGVEAAQHALVGTMPTLEEIGPRLNKVYADQAHTVMGMNDLEVWATALIEACST